MSISMGRKVVVNEIAREDGSGESWNITGYLVEDGHRFEAYFSTKTRKGHMVVEDNRVTWEPLTR